MRVEHIEMIYSTAVVVWTDIITTMCCPIHHVIISPGVQFLPGLLGLAALPHRHGDALAELDLPVRRQTLGEADVLHPRRLLQISPLLRPGFNIGLLDRNIRNPVICLGVAS